jgi:ribosomal protein S18 acetylase RimI-like enzyme
VSEGSIAARVRVRPAHAEEFDAIGHLTLEAYETSGILGTDPGYRHSLLDVAARAQAPGQVLVAVDDGEQLLGAVAYCPWSSLFAEISGPGEAEFRMLAVAPHARGQGVARALIDACRSEATKGGYTALTLCVIDHNTSAAQMYAHLGFARAPDRDWEPVSGVLLRVWTVPLGERTVLDPVDIGASVVPGGGLTATWCERCGEALDGRDHAACDLALGLEPPRYCRFCRRRMVVQVMPTGWQARCREHGITTGASE